VFLTFGLASSILGFTIGLSVVIKCMMNMLLVGRLLNLVYRSDVNEVAVDAGQLSKFKMKEAYKVIDRSKHVVICVVCMFWGLLFFDMIGDADGLTPALTVTLIVMVLFPPLILFTILRVHFPSSSLVDRYVNQFRWEFVATVTPAEKDEVSIGMELTAIDPAEVVEMSSFPEEKLEGNIETVVNPMMIDSI